MKIQDGQVWQETITNYVNNTFFYKLFLKTFHLFLLLLYFADPIFSMIAQLTTRRLEKCISGGKSLRVASWLQMFETSLIWIFHQIVSNSFAYKILFLPNKTSD